MFPWFIGAVVVVSPLFYQIQKAGKSDTYNCIFNRIMYYYVLKYLNYYVGFLFLANCEANVKIWAEKRRKEEEHHKHKWD